jgi:hypothetical protein
MMIVVFGNEVTQVNDAHGLLQSGMYRSPLNK